MDSEIYKLLMSNSDDVMVDINKIKITNIENYNKLIKSYKLINEIYDELKEKEKKYSNHIDYLISLNDDTTKLFMEISRKIF